METSMPDIIEESKADYPTILDKVGIERAEMVMRLVLDDQELVLPVLTDAYVDLMDSKSKGIHMSRLFLTLHEHLTHRVVSPRTIESILKEFVASHREVSQRAFMRLVFTLPIKRHSLKSSFEGWRHYPCEIEGSYHKDTGLLLTYHLQFVYSSTCPCSAALSRQSVAEHFKQSFSMKKQVNFEEIYHWFMLSKNTPATPHGQRSYAKVKLRTHLLEKSFPWKKTIDVFEDALATPVQSVVKREDEQEFARLNAQNFMFAEDAARRLKRAVIQLDDVDSFHIRVFHQESLHPHDAVAEVEG